MLFHCRGGRVSPAANTMVGSCILESTAFLSVSHLWKLALDIKGGQKKMNWYKWIAAAVYITFFTLLIAGLSRGQQWEPSPSYPLPEQGMIYQSTPQGPAITYYSDHGREYTTIGPRGTS